MDQELFYLKDKQTSLLFADGEIKIKEAHESSGYGVRVFQDNKLGFSYCDSEEDLKKTIEQAKKIARFEARGFSFQKKSNYQKMDIFDNKIRDIEERELRDELYKIKEGVEKYTKHCRINIEVGSIQVRIENNNGLNAQYEKTGFGVYAEAMLDDGLGYSYYSSTSLPKDLLKIGEEAGKMAKEMKGAKKLQKGTYTVVFELESLHSLINVLLPSFSGDWKRRKISMLENKIDEKMFSEKLSIYDDATAIASARKPFDDEGTASKKITLVELGAVKNFLYDLETAALDNKYLCGSCARSDYSSHPIIGHSNIIINKGDYNKFEDELGEFLIVKSLHGTHTSNLTTGDFGVEVNAGSYYKNKELRPVRGFIISGNIFNLFNSIQGMEKKTSVFEDLIAPRIAFSNIKVVS